MADEPRPAPIIVPTADGGTAMVQGATTTQRQQLVAERDEVGENRQGLANLLAQFEDTIASLLANHWDFLDAYTDRLWPEQNGTPGGSWPQPPVNATVAQSLAVLRDRTEVLRHQLVFVTYAQTREARLFKLIVAVLREQIIRDPTLAPPPDR